jgi:glucokinase
MCLAVDVGATKLAVGIVTDAGDLLDSGHTPTPKTDDPEGLFGALRGLVEDISGKSSAATPVTCGIGCGGPMSGGGEWVSPLNIPAWRGFPLRRRLAEVTGLPTFIDNDAKALALGEGWMGSGRGHRNFIAMVVSSGVGGGIVLDGSLLDGADGNAGHIGHVIVEPEGRPCSCGGRGCLEAEASGMSIATMTGRPPSEASTDIVIRTGTMVGRALASVVNLLDLEVALVGGSVALGFGVPFFTAANEEMSRRARLSFSVGTKVMPVGLGASAPLVGAAAVGFGVLRRSEVGCA